MLKIDLEKFARIIGEKTSWSYMKRRGFSQWVAHRLASGKAASISFADLERLCEVFCCTPNDLFEWIPNKETDMKNHPLSSLKKDFAMEKAVSRLSYSQLKKIAKAIKEERGGDDKK